MLSHPSPDYGPLTDAFDALVRGDQLAVVVRNVAGGVATNSYLKTDANGKKELVLPWAAWLPYKFAPYGTPEVAGPGIAPDTAPHLDIRPPDVLNVHYTANGSVTGYFARLPGADHNTDRELSRSLADYAGDFDVERRDLVPGEAVCFFGGTVSHEFVSAADDRVSVINSYKVRRYRHNPDDWAGF